MKRTSRVVDARWDMKLEGHDHCKVDVVDTPKISLGPVT